MLEIKVILSELTIKKSFMHSAKMLDVGFFDLSYLSNCDLINKRSLSHISATPSVGHVSISLSLCGNDSSSRSFNELEESFLLLYLIGLRRPVLSFSRQGDYDSFKVESFVSKKDDINSFFVHLFTENMSQLVVEKRLNLLRPFIDGELFDVKSNINVESYTEIRDFLEDNRLDQKLKRLRFNVQTFFGNCYLNLESKSLTKELTQNVSFFWISC